MRIPLSGVSQLKLVVGDGGNGIGVDHALFGDAKLLITNSKPVLELPRGETVKVGETLSDLFGTYRATDAEDGDLTAAVSVEGAVNFDKAGRYPITYRVTDSDGNTVTAQRIIAVVDLRDFTYVSDAQWSAVTCGWGTVKKDQSPGGKTIRLTDENQKEVTFQKGLGTHAVSTITYDLTQLEADYFSSYVGIDRGMYGSVGSVGFEVWVDGEQVIDTGTINSRNPMQYVEVSLAGAKELKLVANDGRNGNGSDHGVWGDAKFYFANPDRANKKPLADLLTETEQLVETVYTQTSWAAFAPIREAAKELMAQENPTQQAVDEMVTRLTEAAKQLALLGDKEPLAALIKEYQSMDSALYTQESWTAFTQALAEAELLLEDKNTTQEILQAGMDTLTAAKEQLILRGDKTELQALVAEVEAMDPTLYRNWELVAAQLEAAKILLANIDATEAELTAQVSALRAAVEELVLSVDLSALMSALAELKEQDLTKFTKNSVVSIKAAVNKAEQALLEQMTQEEADALTAHLQQVLEDAEISPFKALLGERLEVAFDTRYDAYRDVDMWAEYELTRNHYRTVYESETIYTEMEMELMVGFMEQYIEMLEKSK